MGESFIQGNSSVFKINGATLRSAKFLESVPAKSYVFSPNHCPTFLQGMNYSSNNLCTSVISSSVSGGGACFWVSNNKVVSLYPVSGGVGAAITTVTFDTFGSVASMSTTTLSNKSTTGTFVGVIKLSPTSYVYCLRGTSDSNTTYFLAAVFNSSFTDITYGNLLTVNDRYINTYAYTTYGALSPTRFYFVYGNNSSSTNTDCFTAYVYDVSGTTLTRVAAGGNSGDDRYNMEWNSYPINTTSFVLLRSGYAPTLVSVNGSSLSYTNVTDNISVISSVNPSFDYNGYRYTLRYGFPGTTDVSYYLSECINTTFNYRGFTLVNVRPSSPYLTSLLLFADVQKGIIVHLFYSNTSSFLGTWGITYDLPSFIAGNPKILCKYRLGATYATPSSFLSNIINPPISPTSHFSACCYLQVGTLVVCTVPVFLDVASSSSSSTLVGVSKSATPSGSVGGVFSPTGSF